MNYPSIHIYGNILSPDLLSRLDSDEKSGQKPKDFGLTAGQRVRDEISQAWTDAVAFWKAYRRRLDKLPANSSAESETRSIWISPFLGLMGYTLRYESKAEVLNTKSYHISDPAENLDSFPVLVCGYYQELDKKPAGLRMSPHGLMQEYLNFNEEHLYGIVTNGRILRLLRDSGRMVRLSYLEIDLEQMMEEELYADFAVLFRLLHATRMPQRKNSGTDSLIEQYHQDALESGTRIREKLSEAVEEAILLLGNGFVKDAANEELRQALSQGSLSKDEYYRNLLRLIYRLLFLMVIEERDLVYPEKPEEATRRLKDIYYRFYSLGRIRKLAVHNALRDARHHDLWTGLCHTFTLFESTASGAPLAVKPLNGKLFGSDGLGLLTTCRLNNKFLLEALFKLSWFYDLQGQLHPINYKLLNVEEFGSVYEGLLEYDPDLDFNTGIWQFAFVKGSKRSASGSHYTPEELVQPLIKHSLDYLLEEREDHIKKIIEEKGLKGESRSKEREAVVQTHLLSLKVADVACGSGHILLSAARRIADRYAARVEESDQPTPAGIRAAIKQVIRHCIYGVDKNPLAVELCKVALWLEAHNPGEPLSFLDHHIKCGDSIVGLAHREELEKGIADEAFKTLPGDDKAIASALLKRNKLERKTKEQTALLFYEEIQKEVSRVIEKFNLFKNLPERSPEEIKAKTKAHKDYEQSVERIRLKQLADAQLAQFFIPKTEQTKDLLLTDAEYREYLRTVHKGLGPIPSRKLAYASEIVSAKNKFFHWFLEFPEVFQGDGFNCILGNPPFLGGKKISTEYGTEYNNWIKNTWFEKGSSDLVGFFFRRIYELIGNNSFQSLIATNTISQGDTREVSLDVITKAGGTIIFAIKSMKWPGTANVDVSLVTIYKGECKLNKLIGNLVVSNISTLLDSTVIDLKPLKIFANTNKNFQGTIVLGKGFVLSENEAVRLLANNANNSDIILPYINGDDINNSPNQKASRFIINFFDWPIEKAKSYINCFNIITERVKPQRDEVYEKGKQIHEVSYWKYWDKRPELYSQIDKEIRPLGIGAVSKYINYSEIDPLQVFMHKLFVIPKPTKVMKAILQTSIHIEWCWQFSSTMGTSTINYSVRDVFETFPFPQNHTKSKEQQLEKIGEQYHEHRRQLMLSMQLGLTKTYNAFHANEIQPGITTAALHGLNKQAIEKQYGKEVWNLWSHLQKTPNTCSIEEAISGIVKLRELHMDMDIAVLEAYGWQDVQLRHDFYEVDYLPENDRVRYTIHPEARKEILKRLLELNHEIHEEEVKAGLWDKKKTKEYKTKTPKAPEVKEKEEGYGGLFD